MNLKKKAVNGVKWTALSTMINAILQMLQLVFLARYLTPEDFGLVAILTVVVNFSQVFVDFGFSKAIIYKKNITKKQLDTLYWINIIFGILIYSIIYVSSPLIADFYNEGSLEEYLVIISSVLLIQSFGQQYRTLFQKEMKFNILAKIDIIAAIISVISAMILAFTGFGIYALIAPVIIMATIKSCLLIYFGLCNYKPKFNFHLDELDEFLTFGLFTTGNGIVSSLTAQIDIIIIGKLLGSEVLGFYSAAKDLIQRPSQIINPIVIKVAFPAMAKANHDISLVKNMYLKLLNYIASINFPVYILCILLAPEIITIVLGSQWIEITYIFQVLAIWSLIRSVNNPVGALVMAMGKPQYEMYWNTAMLFVIPISTIIGSQWGVEGVAWCNVISILILFIPSWYFLVRKLCGASLKEYVICILSPLLISIFIGFTLLSIYSFITDNIYNKIGISLFGLILVFVLYSKYNKNFYCIVIKMIGKK